jgi:hypothetical protein
MLRLNTFVKLPLHLGKCTCLSVNVVFGLFAKIPTWFIFTGASVTKERRVFQHKDQDLAFKSWTSSKKLKYVPVLVFGAKPFHQPSKETFVNLKKGGLGTL